jgi:choline transporter-like protein 2/4/5
MLAGIGDSDLNCLILRVQIAITGKGFCKASALATELIMKNILRIGKVNVIGDVILMLGKLCVSLFCALFAFIMLDKHKYRSGHNKISSPLVPVLVRDHQALICRVYMVELSSNLDEEVMCFCTCRCRGRWVI